MKKNLVLVLGLVFIAVVGYAQTEFYFDNSRGFNTGDLNLESTDCELLECTRDTDAGNNGNFFCTYTYLSSIFISQGSNSVIEIEKFIKSATRDNDFDGCSNLPIIDWSKISAMVDGKVFFRPVNYKLSANEIGVCSGKGVRLTDYLEDDAGGGTTWSGEGVTGTTFKKSEPGTYTVTATRTFVNGVSTLTLKIIVPGIDISAGAPLNVCHLDKFEKRPSNYMHGRGERPKNGARVEHGGEVINVYYQPEDEINGGEGYADVTKIAGSYTARYVVHVAYPNFGENKKCYFSALKDIIVKNVPSGRKAGDDLEVCYGTITPLELSKGATLGATEFTWKVEGLEDDKITSKAYTATADVRELPVGSHKVTFQYYNNNCFSIHEKTLKVNKTPLALTFPGSSLCGSGTVTLSSDRVNEELPFGNTVVWYDAQEGGNEIGKSGDFLEVETNRVLWGAQETPQGCLSPRVSDRINVLDVPEVDPFSFSRCGKGLINVNLNENNRFDGWKAKWYENNLGGQSLSDDFTYTAGFDEDTRRYIELTDRNDCSPEKRIEVAFKVLARPEAPNIKNSGVCGSGKVTFKVPGLSALNNYVWYALEEDPKPIYQGREVFITDSLTSDKSYYVALKASGDGGGCEGDRQEVIASVWPLPPVLSFPGSSLCGPGTVTLSRDRVNEEVPEKNTVVWYDAFVEGEELGTLGEELSVKKSIVFWGAHKSDKGCFSERIKDTVTVHRVPDVPDLDDVVECGKPSQVVSFSVDLNKDNRFDGWSAKWYDLNGKLLISTPTFKYNIRSSEVDNFRYVAFVDSNGCSPDERSRIKFKITDKPNEPLIVDSRVCGGGAVVFDTPVLPKGEYVWYSSTMSGIELNDEDEDATTFTTVELTNTKKYYVTVRQGSEENSCESSRKEVNAFVRPVPAGLSSPTVSRCGPGTVGFKTIVLRNEGSDVEWYKARNDSIPDNTVLHTGTTFTTPLLEKTTSYFISEKSLYGCLSTPAKATAEIKPITAINLGENVSLCKDASEVLLDDLLPSNITANQGSFTGTGISVRNDKSYFYPNIAGVGPHSIRFDLNDDNKSIYDQFCLASGEKVFTVTEIGNVDATSLKIASQKDSIHIGEWNKFSIDNPDELVIASYDWDLGFGITSSDAEPFHYYYDIGLVDVGVSIQFESGCSYSIEAKDILKVLGLKNEDKIDRSIITSTIPNRRGERTLRVWPNPVTNVIHLRLLSDVKMMPYSLYNNSMRPVKTGVLKNTYTGESGINVHSFPSGIYYLKFHNQVYRLIKR